MRQQVMFNIKDDGGRDQRGRFATVIDTKLRFERLYVPVTESGCWLWIGALNESGYGVFRVTSEWLSVHPGVHTRSNKSRHVMVQAHRASYALVRGILKTDYVLDHLCRVRCCVNPYHVEQVTSKENTLRGFSNSAIAMRRDSCVHGHRYDARNLYLYKGQRMCLECRREAVRRMRMRRNKNGRS